MSNVIEVTDANFEQEVCNSDKVTLVDFWAVWCGPCRMQAPILNDIADELSDKVKVCINRLRGRKTQLADKGVAVVTQFAERMLDIADIESPVAKSGVPGRNINIMVMLAPKKKK